MNVDEALPQFIVESNELLQEMEGALLECGESASPETINLIFRCAHTIKGSAGLFGLDYIVGFVHVVEAALDLVRQGRRALTDELVTLLLSCKDHVTALVARAAAAEGCSGELEARGAALHSELIRLADLKAADEPGASAAQKTRDALPEAQSEAGSAAAQTADTRWQLSVSFAPEVLKSGMDPLAFVRYLTTFTTLESVNVIQDALPPLESFDPQLCYLAFDMRLRTTAVRERIEAAFEFVREDCTLHIAQLDNEVGGEVPEAQTPAPKTVCANDNVRRPVGAASVRVDAHKLDQLITRIGELIIAAAGTSVATQRTGDAELQEHASTVSALVEEVRESALQLRMVKIGGVFDRYKRVVRDLSRELSKPIELEVRGEDTELDKTVVERITDPLTHLVRNAMDHGIESANARAARGKPATGKLTLEAFHDSGSIVIEVSDDGGGLSRSAILAKAQQRGLIEAGRELSDSEIFSLVFEPGFSTAERVTDLSGRGVGLDVVKRNISALRGSIDLRSEEGVGTTFSIRLPLTLAIIHGFQVRVGKSSFVLPLESIDECVEFSCDADQNFTDLRGELLPFVRLREVFEIEELAARRESIVVVRSGAERTGLVVDALLGELQTFIKPLGNMFRDAACITGSSILGNGEVALILDVPALVRQAARRTSASSVIRVTG